MAAMGADGETLTEMEELLGVESPEELAEGCRTLYENLFYTQKRQDVLMETEGEEPEEKQPSVSLANSLWADESLSMKEDYRSLLGEDFYASSFSVDFKQDETWGQMGKLDRGAHRRRAPAAASPGQGHAAGPD